MPTVCTGNHVHSLAIEEKETDREIEKKVEDCSQRRPSYSRLVCALPRVCPDLLQQVKDASESDGEVPDRSSELDEKAQLHRIPRVPMPTYKRNLLHRQQVSETLKRSHEKDRRDIPAAVPDLARQLPQCHTS